jgi:uncharacterized membrane protein
MKSPLRVVSIVLVLAGVVWILQGINVIPGSFMTGQITWAVLGAVAAAVGIALYFLAVRR